MAAAEEEEKEEEAGARGGGGGESAIEVRARRIPEPTRAPLGRVARWRSRHRFALKRPHLCVREIYGSAWAVDSFMITRVAMALPP